MADELMTVEKTQQAFANLYAYCGVPCNPNWNLQQIIVNVLSKLEVKTYLDRDLRTKVKRAAPVHAISYGFDMAVWTELEKLAKLNVITSNEERALVETRYFYKMSDAFVRYTDMMAEFEKEENKNRRFYRTPRIIKQAEV